MVVEHDSAVARRALPRRTGTRIYCDIAAALSTGGVETENQWRRRYRPMVLDVIESSYIKNESVLLPGSWWRPCCQRVNFTTAGDDDANADTASSSIGIRNHWKSRDANGHQG